MLQLSPVLGLAIVLGSHNAKPWRAVGLANYLPTQGGEANEKGPVETGPHKLKSTKISATALCLK